MRATRCNKAMVDEYEIRWDEHEALFELYTCHLTKSNDRYFGLVYWLNLQEVRYARETLRGKATHSHR